MEWLDNLKIGDKVIIPLIPQWWEGVICKLTKKTVYVDVRGFKYLFSRQTGLSRHDVFYPVWGKILECNNDNCDTLNEINQRR